MDDRPPLNDYARANVDTHHTLGAWRWLAAAPLALGAIGGLGWADAPTLLLKTLILAVLTAVVVFAVYLLFRRKMR